VDDLNPIFVAGEAVRVTEGGRRLTGLVGRVWTPGERLAKWREEHEGIDHETALKPDRLLERDGQTVHVWWVEFDDPKPKGISAVEIDERFLERAPE
jgi:hypothetical protein